jgi:glutathione synthase/RimK-type ligase-like ATP-grasp enzyme
VISDELDYRSTQKTRVEPIPVPAGLAQGLGHLTDALGMDFGAADFKTCAETGRLLFLEINTSPMFAAFNAAGRGAVTGAMADYLAGRAAVRTVIAA